MNLANQFISLTVKNEIEHIAFEEVTPEDWNIRGLEMELKALLANDELTLPKAVRSQHELFDIVQLYEASYINQLQELEEDPNFMHSLKYVMLGKLDRQWVTHLETMTRLKEGIGLRSYQQEDPLRIYQREGLELFTHSYSKIAKHIAIDGANAARTARQVEAV